MIQTMVPALRQIARRWLESAVISCEIAGSAALAVSVLCIVLTYAASVARNAEEIDSREIHLYPAVDAYFDSPATPVGSIDAPRVSFPDTLLGDLPEHCPAVSSAFVRYYGNISVENTPARTASAAGYSDDGRIEPARIADHAPTDVTCMAVSPHIFAAQGLEAEFGSLFRTAEYDDRRSVVVLGADLAERMLGTGNAGAGIGKYVSLGNDFYLITGVLRRKADRARDEYWYGDSAAYIPATTRYPGLVDRWNQMSVMVARHGDLQAAIIQLGNYMDAIFGPDTVAIDANAGYLLDYKERMRPLMGLISMLASCILFAGGINTVQILSAQFIHRKSEFAIMRAVGASRGAICKTAMSEASILGLLSGTICIGGTLFVYKALRYVINSGNLPSAGTESLSAGLVGGAGFVVAFLVIILTSGLPAHRATRVPCASMLRSE